LDLALVLGTLLRPQRQRPTKPISKGRKTGWRTVRRRGDIHSKRRGYMRATCAHTRARRVVPALLVTLTPRINIPYAPPVRGFADCQWAENVLDPPETAGKDKETETSFATGSISFVNRTMPDPAVLRLPWRIRFYKADQRSSTLGELFARTFCVHKHLHEHLLFVCRSHRRNVNSRR